MWIKKTQKEIEEAKIQNEQTKKKGYKIARIVLSVGLGGLITIGCTFLHGRMGVGMYGTNIVGESELAARFPIALIIGIIIGVIIYLTPLPKSKQTFVCPKCETVKTDDGEYTCSCGGHFENIVSMKWIENQKA